MDRFEAMSMLVAVVEHGSFSAAARELRVPVPTLSRKVSDLETAVGARLLTRTTRKLSLTDAGVGYVAAAKRILEDVEDAEREAAGEFTVPKGELVVTAPLMFGRLHVLPVVGDFLAQYPLINVRLVLSDRFVDLVEDDVDMAIRIGRLPDSSLVATRLGAMRTVLCGAPGLFAAHGEPSDPEDLARMPCIMVESGMLFPAWQFRKPGSSGQIAIQVTPRLSVSTPDAAADAAIAGVGIARLLCYQAVDAVAAGELKIVLRDFEPETVPIHLVHAARGQMPVKMRRFLDFAAPRLREKLSWIAATV